MSTQAFAAALAAILPSGTGSISMDPTTLKVTVDVSVKPDPLR